MGEDLFYPPNVGGWTGGRSWLSTRAVIARSNAMAALVAGELNSPVRPPDLAAIAARYTDERDPAGSARFLSRVLFGRVDEDVVRKVAPAGRGSPVAPALVALLTSPSAQLH
jgi:hypothetical protein